MTPTIDKAENGIALDTLAQTAHAVFSKCGGGQADWENIGQNDRDKWIDVAGNAILLIEAADGLRFTALAERLYRAYAGANVNLLPAFKDATATCQLIWEAVARHLTNIIDSDGSVAPAEHENRWPRWVADKLAIKETA